MDAPLEYLGRYRLIRRLAAGGMGEVYLGETQGAANFTRRVAIKRILPHLARDEQFVAKFIDEANLMVQLHHGNIVPVFELADEAGELFIAMEYLPGRDLKAVLRTLRRKRETVPTTIALWIMSEICAGLDYAHHKVDGDGQALHIVHRDVSPSNIVLGAGGEVKLVDFGIARARGRLHQSITGSLQGKFVYMSPEQAEGRKVDARSDIFSSCLVLYEMLTGQRPFEGESETETLRRVREVEIVPPSQVRAELDPALDAMVMRALAREPAQRHETAGHLQRQIRDYLAAVSSDVGAGALARYLGTVFPEGVVPKEQPDSPMSVDDALMAQLGSLTPSIDPLGHTRTVTGDEAIERRPTPPPTPGLTPVPMSLTGHVASASSAPRSSHRVWALVGVLAAVGVAAAAYVMRDDPVELHPIVEPAGVEATFSVDDVPKRVPLRLRTGSTHLVCAAAPSYKRDCHLVSADDAEPPKFILRAQHRRIIFDADPAGAEVLVAGKHAARAPATFDLPVTEPILVTYSAPGYETLKRTFEPDQDRIFQRLTPLSRPDATPPDAALVVTTVPDAGIAPTPPPPKRGPAVAPRTIVLTSKPPGAEVRYVGKTLGRTPFAVSLGSRPRTYTLHSSGHRDAHVTVGASVRRPQLPIELEAVVMGRLKVRAFPPLSRILIDGRPVSDNPLVDHELAPGTYTVTAVHPTLGRREIAVQIKPGELTKAPEIDLEAPKKGTP